MEKKYEKLFLKLRKYGDVQILSEKLVFTLLITGDKLTNSRTVNEIQGLVLEYVGNKYPSIECLKNDTTFFCMVLKP